ncbi:MAG: calcium/sodium antiporter [Oscillospiraceae bacterium]|nr:calcium/sodium antiporter [Oscillospiraceae bacterium]
MNIALDIILLIVGFALLVKGADFFVEGAADLARKLKIPSLVVGLTIVALGTSAPELAVSISASCSGANSMAVSNVLGSNIFNLLFVLGVCALIKPVGVTKDILKRDYPVSIIVTILFFVFLIFGNDIGRIEAGVFILLMVGYMIWTVKSALKNRTPEQETEKKFNPVKCALFIVLGAAAIVFGGNFVVDHASNLGAAMGMSETLIGLTICAVGTSLPELVTTIAAARKGETDMAMGNVIGSNIFNVLFILGMSGVISPIEIAATEVTKTLIDSGFYIAICLLAYVFCLTAKKITRVEGGILVFLYVGYTAFAIMRDTGVFAGLLPA